MKTFASSWPTVPSKRRRNAESLLFATLLLLGTVALAHASGEADERPKTLAEFGAQLGEATRKAYNDSPFMDFSKNYFARFSRDPEARPIDSETEIEGDWRIFLPADASALTRKMAGHLADFLKERMGVTLETQAEGGALEKGIFLSETGWIEEGSGERPAPKDRFQIYVKPGQAFLYGEGPSGVRDAVVKLVDAIGFREAPILQLGFETYEPRLKYRLGAIPWGGDYKDLVFMGYNSVFTAGGNLHELSESSWIPELKERQNPVLLGNLRDAVARAAEYGLYAFTFLDTRQKYPADHPVFKAHPDLRGALTWSEDGEYVLCTEHSLVQRYLEESIKDVFEAAPGLEGAAVIIGGEGFYHCYMRPYGVAKGRTNCSRCDPLGAEQTVANLCNRLARAARTVAPDALIAAWPYSAEHVWSADKEQIGLLELFEPGTALLTEIEKDEYVQKGESISKHLWDYSIDLIGPGERAKKQIAACTERGVPVFLKSEPELSFEAPRLSHIPSMDRWWDRADALASCGASGAFVFPAFRPNYGTVAAEVSKHAWWTPVEDKEELLNRLAARVAGPEGGPHLREAWRHASQAVEFSPELPPYYTGPYYLGPMHPMCADREAELPEVFMGYYLFYAEMTDAEGLKPRPTYFKDPRGDVKSFGDYYRRMEKSLAAASAEVDRAESAVPERLRIQFLSEATPIRFFYRTARTHANFYESCRIRDRLRELAAKAKLEREEATEAGELYKRWREVLLDERENATAAMPLLELDVRLDPHYGSDHSFSHGAEMLKSKLAILNEEIEVHLPSVARKLGVN